MPRASVTDDLFDLGPFVLRLRSNVEGFAGRRLFWNRLASGDPYYAVDAITCDGDPRDALQGREVDDSLTARRLLTGHYQGHHFGPPAALCSDGRAYTVATRHPERVIWTYLLKHLLTRYAVTSDQAHLKGGAIRVGDKTILVVGRSGGGKSVLIAEACRRGATFVSNTHVLVDAQHRVGGVATAMRVRDGIRGIKGLPTAHPANEDLSVLPCDVFEQTDLSARTVDVILVVDHRPRAGSSITAVTASVVEDFLLDFALAPSVYGQRNDLLTFSADDVVTLSAVSRRMRQIVRGLSEHAKSFVVNTDIYDDKMATDLLAVLSRG